MSMQIQLDGGEFRAVTVVRRPESSLVAFDDNDVRVVVSDGAVTIDGVTEPIWTASGGDDVYVHAFGRSWVVTVVDPAQRAAQESAGGGNAITAHMPGTAVSIAVAPGDQVNAGQTLMVIESMKMETPILAGRDGVVDKVHCAMGDSFDRGALLVSLIETENEE